MKLTLLIIAVLFAVAFASREDAEKVIQIVNGDNGAKWVATHNKFSDMPLKELKKYVGTRLPTKRDNIKLQPLRLGKIMADPPKSFDSRTAWPNCTSISNILNQGHCGSCWAFAGSASLSDRFCIASKGQVKVQLSPQDLVSCDSYDFGCGGGLLPTEWTYMEYSGVVSLKCLPYVSGDGHVPACPKTCADGKTPLSQDKYYAYTYHHIGWYIIGREKAMMTEISSHGSVEVAFSVYRDFLQYKKGVYHHVTGELLGGHAVKAIGYGVAEDGTKYWIIANSWGTDWGLNGFFWIKKGNNECGIESNCYAGTPNLDKLPSQ